MAYPNCECGAVPCQDTGQCDHEPPPGDKSLRARLIRYLLQIECRWCACVCVYREKDVLGEVARLLDEYGGSEEVFADLPGEVDTLCSHCDHLLESD